jgi:alpha-1,6-mannosyltransferase
MRKQNSIDYGLFLLTLALYAVLGFLLERQETLLLLGSYSVVFILYLYITYTSADDNGPFWFYASIAIRGMLLFTIPNLSDDFYRFIWDGRLLASGYHPFAEVPAYYLKHNLSIPGINEELFQKLNSPDYFTIYPPLAQFIFWLSVKLSPHSIYGSVFVMKLVIFLSEIGTLVVIKKLLVHFRLPVSRVLLYALNPLVILELSGNIHLEAVLIFFLLLSLLLLIREKLILSGIAIAMAICVKLIPLIFLPTLLPRLGWKRACLVYSTIGVVAAVLFLPLLDRSILLGFQNSLAYYFRKFEFNASIYYLVREWGYWNYGYNIIQTAGWLLGLLSALVILIISGYR